MSDKTHAIENWMERRRGDWTALLRELVECESPSDDAAAVTRGQEIFAERLKDIAKPKWVRSSGSYGKNLLLEFTLPGPRTKQPERILGVGHMDTVWAHGTLKTMPFKSEAGRLWGPGVLDMKGGLAMFAYAMRALVELDISVARRVALWVVSDEEIGSPGSRAQTEALAKESRAVLVAEPGTGLEGKLKTARKGVGLYHVKVLGVASHAGVDFTSGANAIVELARQLMAIADFTNLAKGLTVNPGVVRGGTKSNVVAAEAETEIDVRVARLKDAAPLDRRFRKLKCADARCTLEIAGGLNRPPMERTLGVAELYRAAHTIARKELGREIQESATGGGSDGNFTAALGVPTLDGLGMVGVGAHAAHESALEDRVTDRVALLALLVRHLGQ